VSQPQPVTILLVEDDPGHARLIEKNLRRSDVTGGMLVFGDGRRALDYLCSEGDWAGKECAWPLLMLLDLNMPVVDGNQVLQSVKEDKETRRIPVVILTTADDRREVSRCYDMGCNAYDNKPVEYEDLAEAVRRLGLFLSVVALPDGEKV
jgi:CheY-like chemotaxis protein